MAKQVSSPYLLGTRHGATGYITKRGQTLIVQQPGPTRKKWKRHARFARTRTAAEWFGEISKTIGHIWRWMPEGLRRCAGEHAYASLIRAATLSRSRPVTAEAVAGAQRHHPHGHPERSGAQGACPE